MELGEPRRRLSNASRVVSVHFRAGRDPPLRYAFHHTPNPLTLFRFFSLLPCSFFFFLHPFVVTPHSFFFSFSFLFVHRPILCFPQPPGPRLLGGSSVQGSFLFTCLHSSSLFPCFTWSIEIDGPFLGRVIDAKPSSSPPHRFN